jgi:MFS family permease
MFITAFPLLAATLTRDPLLIAGITVTTRLPWLVFSLLTGAIADRMDRRRLMIGADIVRFVIVGLLGIAIVAHVANIWALYVCAFLLGTGETLHVNAAQAILPVLVEPSDLLQANARFGTAQIAATQFAGPPLGVVLFNSTASLPFLADALSFAGSATLIRALAVAIWFWAAALIGLATTSTPFVAVAMYTLLGFGTGFWMTLNTTIRQQATPPHLLGRMSAAYRTVSWGVVPFGAAFGGVAARSWGLRSPFMIGAAVLLSIALFSQRLLRPLHIAIGRGIANTP